MSRLLTLFAALTALTFSSLAHAANIPDTAARAGQFKTLLAAADAAGLVDALAGPGPLTVFAPTDEAFAALPEGTVESLLKPENRDQLVAILTYHVVARRLTSDMLPHQTIPVKPLNESSRLHITKSADGVSVNEANVVAADVTADNGVIHIIDRVLLPK